MAPPSDLRKQTQVLQRLVKEVAFHRKDLKTQEERVAKLKANPDDENAEFMLKQQRQAIEETKRVIPAVQEKVTQAIEDLESLLENNKGEDASVEVTDAEQAIKDAKEAVGGA
ncbi:tubulin binding cofactor A [Corynespora cassiicola Philippines]|uniref:Tubulin-specific chaperone A n=1 Tax=Corynespora cassiicola Philippines TaxID=1448308 RepID=A0A2T2NR73_CORCC|nr:tubulin binding cofactor A [Corynespora cassiicola Philippines]